MLETLNGISVPKAPQGNNFAYLMNAKEIMMWELGVKNAKHIKSLEEQPGMNLDHYYKLNINSRISREGKDKSFSLKRCSHHEVVIKNIVLKEPPKFC